MSMVVMVMERDGFESRWQRQCGKRARCIWQVECVGLQLSRFF